MEISNRNLVIVGASVLLFGISMRVQSGPTSNSGQSTASLGNLQPKPIPDSDFSLVNHYQMIPQVPIETRLGGTPNQNLINLNQAGAIVPGVTKVQNDSKALTVTAPTGNASGSDQQYANTNTPGYGDLGTGVPSATTGNSLLDTTAGTLTDDDQAGFAAMWSTMSAAQRDQFMARLQQNH